MARRPTGAEIPLNYFAHARVATSLGGREALVLGAMLPDFAHMIGVGIVGLAHPDLAEGAALHHRTDAIFHASQSFRALLHEGVRELLAAGLRRGPARGAAHVSVELLFDAALTASGDGDAGYLRALHASPALESMIRWSEAGGPTRWRSLRERLLRAGPPTLRTDPALLAARIVRVLAPRARLALVPAEHAALRAWLAAGSSEVQRRAPCMIDETLAGLRG